MEAVGVAQRDDAAFGQDDEGIRPAHAIASGEDGLLKILLFGKAARNEVHENFTVAAGLEDGAFAFQFAAELWASAISMPQTRTTSGWAFLRTETPEVE